MTLPKRWPKVAEAARMDSIARMQTIRGKCDRLMSVVPQAAMKLAVAEIQNLAMATELDLTRVKGDRE